MKAQYWRDENPSLFTMEDKGRVTLFTTGLPEHTIKLFSRVAAIGGLKIVPLPYPDNQSLAVGKEFGNRGQCNPTYFTVGNLVKHLIHLRDIQGLSTRDILKNYAFVTAGGCGPCRMGMYATEYRQALRNSGFEGFRVLIFSRSGDVKNVLSDGLKVNTKETLRLFLSIGIGDILNTLQLKIRPFEVRQGETQKVISECREIIAQNMGRFYKLIPTLLTIRKKIRRIKVHQNKKRPKVHIMGEFWAKTTEGDGNYNLYRFLEQEGAQVVNETIIDWLLHQVWRAKWETKRRNEASSYWGLLKFDIVDKIIRAVFYSFSYLMGLKDYRLSDHNYIANLARPYFDLHVDGGEDHMEVGHHIDIAKNKKADLVVSVKPFSCLSSNGVSDGIQAKVCADYPESLFVSVETNGDASANFYSRIQMQLHRAKMRMAST